MVLVGEDSNEATGNTADLFPDYCPGFLILHFLSVGMECSRPAGELKIWDLFQCLTSDSQNFRIFESFYSIRFTITREVRAIWKECGKKSWMRDFLQKLQ